MFQAPIQRFADRIASVFVPAIVALATLTFIAWAIVVVVASHKPEVGAVTFTSYMYSTCTCM